MFTSIDKALVALVSSVMYLASSLFDFSFGVDPEMFQGLLVAVTPILVYLFPNKPWVSKAE